VVLIYIIELLGGIYMTYLFYDENEPERFLKDQEMLIKLAKESTSKEEREYYQGALGQLRLFGYTWVMI